MDHEKRMLDEIINLKEVFWEQQTKTIPIQEKYKDLIDEWKEAEKRLLRFAPLIAHYYPNVPSGIIESELTEINNMKNWLEQTFETTIDGNLFLKRDDLLPIAGSIKARGGIYEVLKFAETIAVKEGGFHTDIPYQKLSEEKWRNIFSKYTIMVGSTGNLGLSIGMISKKLGFRVVVHMSSDAKEWKKQLLKENGVDVVEHRSDYSVAVSEGRKQWKSSKNCYFIDDEKSKDLFLGYAVSAKRLKRQLEEKKVIVNHNHPLFVYLPCGVGGAPGGITFGLKHVFGPHVHCIFAEPVNAPCMLLALLTGRGDGIEVEELGIPLKTEADGLAVGRVSSFVFETVSPYIDAAYTINDDRLFQFLVALHETENIRLEPSATAGILGPVLIKKSRFIKQYPSQALKNSTHIVWSTGGGLVPTEQMNEYLQKGKNLPNKIGRLNDYVF